MHDACPAKHMATPRNFCSHRFIQTNRAVILRVQIGVVVDLLDVLPRDCLIGISDVVFVVSSLARDDESITVDPF